MSSAKISSSQILLKLPPVQLCIQCQHSYPSASPIIRKAGQYLQENPANHVPLDHEKPYLKEAMQETLAEIEQCNSELGRLGEIVRQLEERRECLVEVANRLNGMVKTTIRQLPPELLSRIFFMARDEGNKGWLTCRVPLTLNHVCSRWRALVHSEPGLWCIIDVKFRVEDDQDSADRLLEFTKFCLEKSQPKPINVTIKTPEDLYDSDDDSEVDDHYLYWAVWTVLLANCSRWKVADLVLRYDDQMAFAELAEGRMDFPILESLNMCFRDGVGSIETIISVPRVSHMCLVRTEDGCIKPVNLDGLTQLTMEDYHIDDLLCALQDSPNLSNVELKGFTARHRQSFNLPVTSQMKSLQVELHSNGGDIFEQLTLPSVTMLEVTDPPRGRFWTPHRDNPQLCQFVSRSRPPITHLLLSTVTLPHEEIMGTLALLPTITHLGLEDGFRKWAPVIMKEFLRHMTIGRDFTDSILLPNLTDLRLHFGTQFENRTPSVLDMVESRCYGAVHGLRQKLVVLRLTLWGESEASEILVGNRIDVFRKDGLDVEVEFRF
ncbi:hypothetical protein WG66_008129 [Moniliophthora roreri]|uniref:Uncharacterized protein n=1 Tax=Moniliophthora roreri TaxID=221103 RepID=A0A0W0GFR7_MONRR|nr:hypothetical protein WG66_008129 [Moniliophthora roreri]